MIGIYNAAMVGLSWRSSGADWLGLSNRRVFSDLRCYHLHKACYNMVAENY